MLFVKGDYCLNKALKIIFDGQKFWILSFWENFEDLVPSRIFDRKAFVDHNTGINWIQKEDPEQIENSNI